MTPYRMAAEHLAWAIGEHHSSAKIIASVGAPAQPYAGYSDALVCLAVAAANIKAPPELTGGAC